MNRRDFHIGPGAASLLLVAVVVSMGILGMLAMMSVRTDVRLTDRSETMILSQNAAAIHAEEQYAALDELVIAAVRTAAGDNAAFLQAVEASLPESMTLEENVVSWTEETDGGMLLHCAVRVQNTLQPERVQWVTHATESSVGNEEMD